MAQRSSGWTSTLGIRASSAFSPRGLVTGAEVLHRVDLDALGVLEERLVEQPPEAEDLDLVPVLQVPGEVQHRARRAALPQPLTVRIVTRGGSV